MICKECGKELADSAKFCTGCGTPVNGQPVAQPEVSEVVEPEIPDNSLTSQVELVKNQIAFSKENYERQSTVNKQIMLSIKQQIAQQQKIVEQLKQDNAIMAKKKIEAAEAAAQKAAEAAQIAAAAAEKARAEADGSTVNETSAERHCPNCNAIVMGKFCHVCGTKMEDGGQKDVL